jgi:hypothetical protein
MKYLVKLLQTQDLRSELFIENKYLGAEKFFPDPFVDDTETIGTEPRKINITLINNSNRERKVVTLKTFVRANGNRQDTRIAPAGDLFFNSQDLDCIIVFEKLSFSEYLYSVYNVNSQINKRIRTNLLGRIGKYYQSGFLVKLISEIIPAFNLNYTEVENKYGLKLNDTIGTAREIYKFEERVKNRYNDGKEKSFSKTLIKLKGKDKFNLTDENDLTNFILCLSESSNNEGIFRISNWINGFKTDTVLPNNSKLKLFELFNQIKDSKTFSEFKTSFVLSDKLAAHAHLLYFVVKYFQDSKLYPIYYVVHGKLFEEIIKENFTYDEYIDFYRTFPEEERDVKFSAYWETLVIEMSKIINSHKAIFSEEDESFVFLCGKKDEKGKYNGGLFHIQDFRNEIKIFDQGDVDTFKEYLTKFPPSDINIYIKFLKDIITKFDLKK